MTDELDIDSELVEKVLEEYHLRSYAHHHVGAALVAAHVDLVCHGCEVIAACARILSVSDNRFA